MTDEELDRARSQEAHRMWTDGRPDGYNFDVAATAARLAREGWTPPDPLVAEVNKLTTGVIFHFDKERLAPTIDDIVRKAIERGIEIGRDHG